MRRTGTRAPELALPTASLAALRKALAVDVGADAAARALQNAGFAAGDALFQVLSSSIAPADASDPNGNGDIGQVGSATFWKRLSELFATRGWGRPEHSE